MHLASVYKNLGFPGDTVVDNLPANTGDARDMGSIRESEISPGVGNGKSLQYSSLGNSMDRGAWRATAHGVAELDMTQHACIHVPAILKCPSVGM